MGQCRAFDEIVSWEIVVRVKRTKAIVRQGTREGHWCGCRRNGLTRAKTDPWKQQRDESSSLPPTTISLRYFPWAKPNRKAGGQSTQVVSRIEAGLQGTGDAKDGPCGWKGKGLEQGHMSSPPALFTPAELANQQALPDSGPAPGSVV